MKTVLVRIGAEQAKELEKYVGCCPGGKTISSLTQRAVRNFLDVEAPVYAAKLREAEAKLKRQDVSRIH